MSTPLLLVDAFAEAPFSGNPAAVCVLASAEAADAAGDAWMQGLAAEMNQSETAFVWPVEGGRWGLRWFTPAAEVELCGHATLASAHALWERGDAEAGAAIRFATEFSGELACTRLDDGRIAMDFPADPSSPADPPDGLLDTLGLPGGASDVAATARATWDWLVELRSAEAVRAASPDFGGLGRFDVRGVCLTTRSGRDGVDIESRFFAPRLRIEEDPVTGSLHCALAEYWGPKLGKGVIEAYQASRRGGRLRVRRTTDAHSGERRVELAGRAVTVLRGELVRD